MFARITYSKELAIKVNLKLYLRILKSYFMRICDFKSYHNFKILFNKEKRQYYKFDPKQQIAFTANNALLFTVQECKQKCFVSSAIVSEPLTME